MWCTLITFECSLMNWFWCIGMKQIFMLIIAIGCRLLCAPKKMFNGLLYTQRGVDFLNFYLVSCVNPQWILSISFTLCEDITQLNKNWCIFHVSFWSFFLVSCVKPHFWRWILSISLTLCEDITQLNKNWCIFYVSSWQYQLVVCLRTAYL